jgi:hypothetical protein
MYKKLAEWQQHRRDVGPRETDNEHGVDPTAFSESRGNLPPWKVPDTYDAARAELGKLRVQSTEIKEQIVLSRERLAGRRSGQALSQTKYGILNQRRSEISQRIAKLEMFCSAERTAIRNANQQVRSEKAVLAEREKLIKAHESRPSIAEIFMDMAREMLAEDVYGRVFVAAVHRHREREEDAKR